MGPFVKGLTVTFISILGLGLWACEAPLPVIPDNNAEDTPNLDASDGSDSSPVDAPAATDADSLLDVVPVEDQSTVPDTPEIEDTTDEPETSEPDVTVEPDVEKEDLSNVKLTWKKDIEPISSINATIVTGKRSSTRSKVDRLLPHDYPAWKRLHATGHQSGSGQLEDIILWGKVGYPNQPARMKKAR